MDKVPIGDIQETIGYHFKNKRLLEQAFVRSSYANENPGYEDNEKLEFYGDAALDYYVTRRMYLEFSKISEDKQFKSLKSEHELTELKSYNVDSESLAHCISITGFQNYLLMGESDIKNNAQKSSAVMADLFEAILGAVVVDSEWNYKKISIVCKSMLKLLNFEINYIKWLKHWCAEKGFNEPIMRPKIDFMKIQWNQQMNLYNFGNPFYTRKPDFSDLERNEQIIGAYLYIKELDLRTYSNLRYEYAAYMECARNAYEKIQKIEMENAIGKPDKDSSVNQLNVLFQKGFITEPVYSYTEEHDENGNPIWSCLCTIDDNTKSSLKSASGKKDAKKEAAFEALIKIFKDNTKDLYEEDFFDELRIIQNENK